MTVIKSPLSDENRQITGEALQGALVDLVDLSLLSKQAHWNLVGRGFRSGHLQLDEVVDLAREHSDVVAERAVAIGYNPDGRAATVSKEAGLPSVPEGFIAVADVIDLMVDVLTATSERFRSRIDATEEADPVSQDILIAITQDIEQQLWMWQAMR